MSQKYSSIILPLIPRHNGEAVTLGSFTSTVKFWGVVSKLLLYPTYIEIPLMTTVCVKAHRCSHPALLRMSRTCLRPLEAARARMVHSSAFRCPWEHYVPSRGMFSFALQRRLALKAENLSRCPVLSRILHPLQRDILLRPPKAARSKADISLSLHISLLRTPENITSPPEGYSPSPSRGGSL